MGATVIRFRLSHAVRGALASFWFWPLVFIGMAIYLAEAVPMWASALPTADQAGLREFAVGAQAYTVAVLTTTAAADITILTFIFSTLMIVLQLASSQLSPRVLRPILRRGTAQRTMGIMAGGFVFSVWSLLSVTDAQHPFAVIFSIAIAILWTFLVLIAFLHFVSFTISRIRAPAVIRSIAEETTRSIRRLYQFREGHVGIAASDLEATHELRSPKDGVLTGIGARELVAWAQRLDAAVELDVGLGDYMSQGVPIGRVRGLTEPRHAAYAARFLVVEQERTLRDDPPYGFRLLVDIAIRALSPAVNDPTTAVQVLDALQSLLVLLAERPDSQGRMHGSDGVVRLEMPTMSWRAYLRLAVQEIYEYGAGSSQVTQRIARMLDDLAEVASESQAQAVRELRAHVEVVPPLIP